MKKVMLFTLVLGLMSAPIAGCGNSISEKESKVEEQSINKVLSSEEILKYDEYLQVPTKSHETLLELRKKDCIDSIFEKIIYKSEESMDIYDKTSIDSNIVETTLKDGFYFLSTSEIKAKFKLQDETLKRIIKKDTKVFFTADQLANCSEVILKEETSDTITLEVNDYDYENDFLAVFSISLGKGVSIKADAPAILEIDKKNKYLKSISISKLKSDSSEEQGYESFEYKQEKLDSQASIEAPKDADSYVELPEKSAKEIENQMLRSTI